MVVNFFLFFHLVVSKCSTSKLDDLLADFAVADPRHASSIQSSNQGNRNEQGCSLLSNFSEDYLKVLGFTVYCGVCNDTCCANSIGTKGLGTISSQQSIEHDQTIVPEWLGQLS